MTKEWEIQERFIILISGMLEDGLRYVHLQTLGLKILG